MSTAQSVESNEPQEATEVVWDDRWAVPVPDGPTDELHDRWDEFRKHALNRGLTDESLLDGVEKVYSTSQTAAFFGKSNQWVYWGLKGIFTYKDGSPIQPERVGPMGKRRFTLPIIREIAMSCYRRGNLTEEELTAIMREVLLAEFGEQAFAP